MKTLVCLIALFFSSFAYAGHGRFGPNAGLGVPYLGQVGVNFYFSDNLGIDVDYGQVEVTSNGAKAKLTLASALLKYHPLSGNWYIAGGVGKENAESTATDASTSQTATIKIDANAAIAKTGWMWGSNDGGLWFGMDISYISPFSPNSTVTTALPPSNSAYQDAKDAADRFGSTAYWNFTFARVGYLF